MLLLFVNIYSIERSASKEKKIYKNSLLKLNYEQKKPHCIVQHIAFFLPTFYMVFAAFQSPFLNTSTQTNNIDSHPQVLQKPYFDCLFYYYWIASAKTQFVVEIIYPKVLSRALTTTTTQSATPAMSIWKSNQCEQNAKRRRFAWSKLFPLVHFCTNLFSNKTIKRLSI